MPIVGVTPGAPLGPTRLSGTSVQTDHDIVLGATTMAALHTEIGQTVTVHLGKTPARTRRNCSMALR